MSSPIMFADRVVTNQSDIMSGIKMFVINQRPLSEPVCRLLASGLMVATADRNSRAFCGQEASFYLFFFSFRNGFATENPFESLTSCRGSLNFTRTFLQKAVVIS